MSVLVDILAAKRRRLDAGEIGAAGAAASSSSDGERFRRALTGPAPRIIAEIKHRSPSAGVLLPDADRHIERVARAYRRGGAAALSVVIERDFFGGDPAWLPRAKAASGLPVLMKDFVVDERQLDLACSLGADAVLLIAAALTDAELRSLRAAALAKGLAALVEVHDEEELRRALASGAVLVGVNARDLRTFAVDLGAMARVGAAVPDGVVAVAESGLKTHAELSALGDFDAFLVGGSLLTSGDETRALRALRGAGTTEVKICGLTREEDLAACAELGVDYVGLNFSPRSPRRLDAPRGAALRAAAAFAKGVVAVFAGNAPREIREIAEGVGPDVLQLTDPPRPGFAESWPLPVWRTVRVGRDDLAAAQRWPGDALLYDTAVGGISGGTGRPFDWSVVPGPPRPRPVVLAGGLNAENVARAVRAVRPDVVDVASGVESAPGVKDAVKLRAFVEEVRRA